MDRRWIFAVILGTFPAAAASAQQSHLDMRRQIEQLAATFSERYNKQDAGAIASMFTKDAVRVTSGNSAPSVGPQAIEKTFKTQFESGFRHIELEIDQVSPFGTDAAIDSQGGAVVRVCGDEQDRRDHVAGMAASPRVFNQKIAAVVSGGTFDTYCPMASSQMALM